MLRVAMLVLLLALSALGGCAQTDTGRTTSAAPSTSPAPSSASTSTTTATTGPTNHFFDFGGETAGSGDLSGWTVRADVPSDPNNGGVPVRFNVTACDDAGWEDHVHIQYHPVHSACYFLDGRQDDGTVWLSRGIPVQRGTAYRINVSVQAWGEESFNTVADLVLRLGVTGAQAEGDFSQSEPGDHAAIRRPLDIASGWTLYGMTWPDTGPLPTDTLVLDVGISAIWETEMTRYLDAVTVELVPLG